MFFNRFTSAHYAANEILSSIVELQLPTSIKIPVMAEILENPEFIEQANLNTLNNQGLSPLHIAIMQSDHQLVDFFLNKSDIPGWPEPYDFLGADVEMKTREGHSPLHLAAKYSDAAMIRRLKFAGADIESINNHNMTPLMSAISNLNLATAKQLLRLGADSNTIANDRTRPLHLLASFSLDHIQASEIKHMAQLLIDYGADLEARDVTGKTPLLVAASAGNISLIEALSTRPSTRSCTDIVMGLLGLHQYKSANLYATVENTNLESINDRGNTIFHTAIINGQLDVIDKLIELAPGLINVPNAEGFLPLDLAYSDRCIMNYGGDTSQALCQKLLDHGARLSRRTDSENTRDETVTTQIFHHHHTSRPNCHVTRRHSPEANII
jgi:ankyrin repeat protein